METTSTQESPQSAVANTTSASADAVSDVTAQNATTSRLLRLPAELRNRIYEYCVELQGAASGFWHGKEHRQPPPIMQVCRQIREESFSMYYITGHFRIRGDENIVRWIKAIGPEARALVRKIILYTFDEWMGDPPGQKDNLLRRLKKVYARLEEEGVALPAGTLRARVTFSDLTTRIMNEIEIQKGDLDIDFFTCGKREGRWRTLRHKRLAR